MTNIHIPDSARAGQDSGEPMGLTIARGEYLKALEQLHECSQRANRIWEQLHRATLERRDQDRARMVPEYQEACKKEAAARRKVNSTVAKFDAFMRAYAEWQEGQGR